MRLTKVWPPPAPRRPETASQTLLRRVNECAYAAFLELAYRDVDYSTPAMKLGLAAHECFEVLTVEAIKNGEVEIPGEVAREMMMAKVVKHAVPVEYHDDARAMAWRWAANTYLEPRTFDSVERTLGMELEGWHIRGRLDQLDLNPQAKTATITDYKTGLWVPPQEETDKSFQAWFYALMVAEGQDEAGAAPGGGIDHFTVRFVYPRVPLNEGGMMVRNVLIERPDLWDFKQSVGGLLKTLERGFEQDEWPASPGTHCAICPDPGACPIPENIRPIWSIETEEDAREAAKLHHVIDKRQRKLQNSLREWAKQSGKPIDFGDQRWSFVTSESERVDREAVKLALSKGEVNTSKYFKTATTTRFSKKRRLP